MSEPTTAEGRALLDTVRHSIYDAEMRAAILAIEAAAAEAEREAERARIRAAVRDPLIELSLFIADNSYGEDRAELESYLRLVLAAIDATPDRAEPSKHSKDHLWRRIDATPDRADHSATTETSDD